MSSEQPLTAQQEEFCKLVAIPDAKGKYIALGTAYQKAYHSTGKIETAQGEAWRLRQDPRIIRRIKQLRDELNQLYIEQQLPFSEVVKPIKEGLKAKLVKTATKDGKITDQKTYVDHQTRLDAAELALKVRGELKDKLDLTTGDQPLKALIGVDIDDI